MAYGTAKVDTLQTSTKTVQVDDLAVSADLGTAAAEDVGTAAGNVVQLDGSARLPAVDGSQLTNLPVAVGTDLSYTASTRVLASSTGADATLPEATTSEAGLLSAADKTKLDGIAAADATPQALGVAAIGTSTDYAREDHVHAMPSAGDVGADPAGTASSAVSSHEAAADPHPGYALESGLAAVATSGAYADLSGTPSISDIYIIACSDESTALTTGTAKVTLRMPSAGTLTGVKATVTTAPVGSALVVDINEGGTSVLSTKLSIDDGESTSTTAATPAVISDSALASDAVITIDIDQVGSSTAGAGLKVTLYITRG
jgi:hypothetical protein